jgi:hypothetical protein
MLFMPINHRMDFHWIWGGEMELENEDFAAAARSHKKTFLEEEFLLFCHVTQHTVVHFFFGLVLVLVMACSAIALMSCWLALYKLLNKPSSVKYCSQQVKERCLMAATESQKHHFYTLIN